jgi:DNA-binding transcriptional LysR family regulator
MDLNLRQIRTFLTVAQHGSFTRAADMLHLAQPTLTVQIRRLEEALQVKLFDRNTRSVSLTRVGKELLPVFERMVNDLDAVITDTRDIAAMRRGIVRIAALPSMAAGILPATIRTFRETHTGAAFVVKDAIAGRVMGMVRDEEVDIGIMGGVRRGADIDVLFEKQERLLVVFREDHWLAECDTIGIDEIASCPVIMLDPATSIRGVVEDAFLSAGKTINVACEATYMMTAVGMVSGGLGITILPETSLEISAFKGIRSSSLESDAFVRSVSVIAKSGRTLPPLSRLFAEALTADLDMQLPNGSSTL